MYGELVPVLVQQLLLSALVTRHAHGPAPALALLACSAALLALLLATKAGHLLQVRSCFGPPPSPSAPPLFPTPLI